MSHFMNLGSGNTPQSPDIMLLVSSYWRSMARRLEDSQALICQLANWS